MTSTGRFSPTVPSNGHALAFDDSQFDQVTVPHTNRMLPWHGFDDRTYEFVSLYRRSLNIPKDSAGKRVDTGKTRVSGSQMSVSLRPGGTGTYHVTWRVLSVDTHTTDGSFTFQVGQ